MSGYKTQNLPVDAVIFDIDGVLVDVSNSYRQAIIQTVQLFFTTGLGMGCNGKPVMLLDAEDVDILKLAGGFNNNWDITTAFIVYFLEMLPPLATPTFPIKRYVPAILAYLQMAGTGYLPVTIDMLREHKDIARLAKGVKMAGGGLIGTDKALTHRNRHLIIPDENLLKGNLIKRIFQELYLGATLFNKTYGEDAIVTQTDGLINNETLLINPEILNSLAKELSLGIATSRPKAEAEYSLNQLKIKDYFQSLVTYDDIVQAEAEGKPDPWSLLEAARKLHPTPARSAYIGNFPDDILAAKAANKTVPFLSIGSLAGASDKELLRRYFEENGADIIIGHPDRLKKIIFR